MHHFAWTFLWRDQSYFRKKKRQKNSLGNTGSVLHFFTVIFVFSALSDGWFKSYNLKKANRVFTGIFNLTAPLNYVLISLKVSWNVSWQIVEQMFQMTKAFICSKLDYSILSYWVFIKPFASRKSHKLSLKYPKIKFL